MWMPLDSTTQTNTTAYQVHPLVANSLTPRGHDRTKSDPELYLITMLILLAVHTNFNCMFLITII